tara:strand:+ start:70 stop:636 length:567 start_codon:yes stop_codon:yes gene_type:complete
MKKEGLIIGYTAGVYDLFHIGHLNILRNAKAMCDFLIVGVSTDELVMEYKGKKPFTPFEERIEIVRNFKDVDMVVPQYDMDKAKMCKQLRAKRVFVGGWHGTEKWDKLEAELNQIGIEIFYFPYTKGVSSTKINKILEEKRKDASKEDIEEFKNRMKDFKIPQEYIDKIENNATTPEEQNLKRLDLTS